jgi:hypothetical protein
MQASFLLQEAALALSMGMERIEVYKWVDEPPPLPGFEPYGMIRADGSTRPVYDAYRAMTTSYAVTTAAARFERPEMWTVALMRGEATTRVLWARGPYRVVALLPALAGSAYRIDQTGAEHTIHPIGGLYLLGLDSAPCTPDEGCIMGGPPLLIVEEAPADLSDPAALVPRLAFDLTPRTVGAGIGAGALGITLLTGAALFLRRRARR